MTRILHLVLHDLRAHRVSLLVYVGFLLTDAVLTGLTIPTGLRLAGAQFVVVRLIFVAVLSGLIVQTDALVGTTAFWRTRPIARSTLLAAKATLLAVAFVVVPGVMTWLTWARLGLAGGDAALVAAGVMLENAAAVLLASLAASVTPSLVYLIVAAIAGGTMVSLIHTVVLPALLTTWPFVGLALIAGQPVVYLAVLFGLGIPTLVYQFLRLEEWHTAAFVAVTLLAATTATRFWPAAEPPPWPPLDQAYLDPASVSVSFVPDSVRRNVGSMPVAGQLKPHAIYTAALTADGVPGRIRLWAATHDTRWLLRDRTVSSAWRQPFTPVGPSNPPGAGTPRQPDVDAAIWPAKLPDDSVPYRRPVGTSVRIMSMPVHEERPYEGQRALVTTDVTLLASRRRITATMKPEAGSRATAAGASAEVVTASTDGRSAVVRFRVARVSRSTPSFDFGRWEVPFSYVVLRNAARREALEPARCSVPDTVTATGASGIVATRSLVQCVYTTVGSVSRQVRVDEAWLAGAELVAVGMEPLGAFTRHLQMDVNVGPQPTTVR